MGEARMETSTAPKDYGMTTEYDYGDTTPCRKVQERAFGAQLLPPLYSVVFVIGLVGNILVVLVLMQYKRLKSMTSIYLLNLAMSDLIFLFTLPFWIDYTLKDDWIFGDHMCKLLSGLYFLGLYSEIFFIILLTIDRYLAIVHAVFALRARTVTFGIITSIVTWVLAILASVPGLYFSKTQWEFTHYTCSLHFPPESLRKWKQFQALKLNILGLVLPLLVMVVSYSGIIKVLLRQPNEKKSKAVRLIFVIMIIFFLFWTPYNLTVFVSAFQDSLFTRECEQSRQLDMAIQVTQVIAYTHCCINPVIYVFVGERFRKYLRQLFHQLVAVRLAKCLPFLSTERLERVSSMSPSTREHELSAGF
ncbi:C-C chemokine receptor type 1 [Physeter macrocephalus]|uniref:C-C chemokine receptor type 1 n=1 Tax=Physeter macrocephalus TaxID=9755 RepID=A0A2Y9FLE2_PHYMC|nr:C-C chemokine receptor type 1 [Physeter catodon]|eukprot:XP_007126159.2 C-C chemokine receptor type 1 [Physeter catodon]